ncbi:PREDICTED: regulator of G-protein signaling 14 [Nanorana parkeri]|uniref:regulator of G-protein signaling 14 n=1 Tax=Nanorana parkeri TaxID=125878 RepID=UPI000854D470|nr:PREDICTED: regulator of G-protein signaling 14 [Nanorana parkeri]
MFSEPERKRSLQFLEFSFWEARNTRSRLSTLRNKFRASKSFYINRSLEKREVLAVSDGELNNADLDGRGSDQSLNSLPSGHTAGFASDRSVATWAVSFERLLQDPVGIEYFTEFLTKEYSAENIHFWKSCEKFQIISEDDTEQLLQESRRIYNEYLSSSSLCPVNVDQQALITEEMLMKPSPHLFKAQQQQIFNLMKFDSYARFVKSPLYQECMLSEVEGRPLPKLSSSAMNLAAGCTAYDPGAIKKKQLRPGKSLPLDVEATGSDMTEGSKLHRRSFKKRDRRSNARDCSDNNGVLSRHESDGSLNSAISLDLISTASGKSENGRSRTNSLERESEWKHIKYCCVYLPDGTASLTAIKPGHNIREMLAGVCEKRGYRPSDVKVYLAGHDQKALALDQDCGVLSDQEVRLENRISFELQIESLNKNLRIVARPSKTIQEALQSILKKYGLNNQHFVLKKMGEPQAVDQSMSVSQVAGLTLILHTFPDVNDPIKTGGHTVERQVKVKCYLKLTLPLNSIQKEHATKEKTGLSMTRADHHHRANKESSHANHASLTTKFNKSSQVKNRPYRPNNDIEGLVEMLNRVQSTRADNQRGLLCKEDLVLPEFLKLPTDETCDSCHLTSFYSDAEVLQTDLHLEGSAENCREQNRTTDSRSTSPETVCLSLIEDTIPPLSEASGRNDTTPTVTIPTVTTPTVTISDLSLESAVMDDKPHTEENDSAM